MATLKLESHCWLTDIFFGKNEKLNFLRYSLKIRGKKDLIKMNSNLDFKALTPIGSAKANESMTKHKDYLNNLSAMLCDSNIIHDCSGLVLLHSYNFPGESNGYLF